jgi:hypothetical protein
MTATNDLEAQAERRVLKAAFLGHYRLVGNVTKACELAGIGNRTRIYEWQQADDTFAHQMAEARVQAIELLEAEARRRAYDGWAEPVYQRGVQVGTVTRYSDNLMMFLLKGLAPETYRDRLDVRAITTSEVQDTLTEDQREGIRAILLRLDPAQLPQLPLLDQPEGEPDAPLGPLDQPLPQVGGTESDMSSDDGPT